MKTITVLGNFSGRNAGDAAILGSLLEDISAKYDNVLFKVPTINTRFVKKAYSKYNVKAISLLPWHLSVKIFGVPTFRAALTSDLVLVTDAILFDRKLYDPLYNYLWTLSKVLPLAKKRGIPVVLYNCSLGPVKTKAGQACLRKVIDSANVVILRDDESFGLLEKLKIKHSHVHRGADCALNVSPATEERFEKVRHEKAIFQNGKPVIGFNINSYVDAYVREKGAGIDRTHFIESYANVVDRVQEDAGAEIVLVETQHMDMGIANELLSKLKKPDKVHVVSNKEYSYQDICAVLQRMEMFVGMRTHSLIFSSAMQVPVSGIVTYPKNRGYMNSIGLGEQLLEFSDFSSDSFFNLIKNTWDQRDEIREKLAQTMPEEKEKARSSADFLEQFLK